MVQSEIIDHNNKLYKVIPSNNKNGVYFYSREIVKNIASYLDLHGRKLFTVNVPALYCDNMVIFIHTNRTIKPYRKLAKYNNVICICIDEKSAEMCKELGKTIICPINIDTKKLDYYKSKVKDFEYCYFGRSGKLMKSDRLKLHEGTHVFESIHRATMLYLMARTKNAYCIGRTAMEAKYLGCNLMDYNGKHTDINKEIIVRDNKEVISIIQEQLNKIDELC